MPENEYIEVDPVFRKRFIIECILLFLFGLALILWIYPAYLRPLMPLYPVYSFWIIQVLIISILTCMALSWYYILKIGLQTLWNKQYPPNGSQVLKKTRIVEGDTAIRRGRCLVSLATVCIVACIGMAAWIAKWGLDTVRG